MCKHKDGVGTFDLSSDVGSSFVDLDKCVEQYDRRSEMVFLSRMRGKNLTDERLETVQNQSDEFEGHLGRREQRCSLREQVFDHEQLKGTDEVHSELFGAVSLRRRFPLRSIGPGRQ